MKTKLAPVCLCLASSSANVWLGACSERVVPEAKDRVLVAIEPRIAERISNARYTITLEALDVQLWKKTVDSEDLGGARGVLELPGPCDPRPEAQPNKLTIVLDRLEVQGIELPPTSWKNPTPLTYEFECVADTETRVPFDLPIMTGLIQGRVTFDDIICAAEFSCQDGLLDPRGPGDITGVLGFSCTGGLGERTTLYMSDLTVMCDAVTKVTISPATIGQRDVTSDIVFATGTYIGRTADPSLELCYWNSSVALRLSSDGSTQNPANCRFSARATAAVGPLGALPGGATPPGSRYAYVSWSVPLTDAAGQLVCGDHPLNGADGTVAAVYTSVEGATFRWPYECGDHPRQTCAGETQTVSGAAIIVDEPVPGQVQINVGGALGAVQLPEGYVLDNDVGCCISPCCDVSGTTP